MRLCGLRLLRELGVLMPSALQPRSFLLFIPCVQHRSCMAPVNAPEVLSFQAVPNCRPVEVMSDTLDSQAAAFARLLKLSGDPDAAFRSAVALAEGLFPHQIEGVAFLLGRRRAILADDMGLGKTRQAIVSLRHLTPGGPRLVVCPASVKRNWAREIAVVAPDAAVLVIEGARRSPRPRNGSSSTTTSSGGTWTPSSACPGRRWSSTRRTT